MSYLEEIVSERDRMHAVRTQMSRVTITLFEISLVMKSQIFEYKNLIFYVISHHRRLGQKKLLLINCGQRTCACDSELAFGMGTGNRADMAIPVSCLWSLIIQPNTA